VEAPPPTEQILVLPEHKDLIVDDTESSTEEAVDSAKEAIISDL
jgi:hypothetical protein